MLRKSLIMKLFGAFSIQRWNDQIRPLPLIEMDKHAHKMAIAYCLAQYEKKEGNKVSWHHIIQGGIFELLKRAVLSDIKSPIYNEIKDKYPDAFKKLNEMVVREVKKLLANDDPLLKDIDRYLNNESAFFEGQEISRDILAAAHLYASYWEFNVIRPVNPGRRSINDTETKLLSSLNPFNRLVGMKKLLEGENIAEFIDIVGQLRFQVRWGQTVRLPATSVLGHSMMVATLAYLLTRELKEPPCGERLKNNFFSGLFHDIPEALTRDIIAPLKREVEGLKEVIGKIEQELVKSKIHKLLDDSSCLEEFRYLTENEFESKIVRNKVTEKQNSDVINREYNKDEYSPVDGELVDAADQLAAYVEARSSIDYGVKSPDLVRAEMGIKDKQIVRTVAGIDLGDIYDKF